MISVIIPVYRVEEYLSRCVKSVVDQTYRNIEVILVDDGSPDNCPKLCDEWMSKDSRIKVLHKKNGGLSSARNAGLEMCSGEYVFFIDSDDWLSDTNVLQDFYDSAIQNNSDFVFALMNTASENSIQLAMPRKRYRQPDLFFLSNPYLFSACNKLYKSSLMEFISFVPGRINEDVDVIPLVFCHAKNPNFLNRATYNYYQNNQSITRSEFSEKRFDMFKSVENAYLNFSGSKKQKKVFHQNLFGFQLFSVYIEIFRLKDKLLRKKYAEEYLNLLFKYDFRHFFLICFECFLSLEPVTKKAKKIPLLIILYFQFLKSGVHK